MASGHVNRANRPNTWLLRPTPQVKILLANPEPSTHGPSSGRGMSAIPPLSGRVEMWRGDGRLNISVCRPFRLAVP